MRIISSSSYIPEEKISNEEIEKRLKLEKGYIEKRTGIKNRQYAKEPIEEMAKKTVEKLIEKTQIEKDKIGAIIVATTSTNKLMPGISNYIQKELKIPRCMCFDILAGCSGFVNAVDIAQMYLKNKKIKKAIVVGVDKLSEYVNKEDIGTAIILADGAGATLLEEDGKEYYSNIESIEDPNEIVKCTSNEKIKMEGLSIYKYAVTETVKNIKELLENSKEKMENIDYIVPHQSNLKIMLAIENRLNIEPKKMYINIQNIGNTFCASIPIALAEMEEKNLLQKNKKIVIIGYGGRTKHRKCSITHIGGSNGKEKSRRIQFWNIFNNLINNFSNSICSC